jgi:GAF domain-containing protein
MIVKSVLDRYLGVQVDDVLVAQRGRLLNVLILTTSVAILGTLFADVVAGRLGFLPWELSTFVIFGVLYRYTRRGHRWPPYVFLVFIALSAPYVVREDLASPVVLGIAVPVVVAPLIVTPWVSIPVAALEAVMLGVFGLGTHPSFSVAVFILGVLGVVSWLSSSSLENAFKESRRNANALAEINRELEASRDVLQVQTDDLARRARYLEATAAVARGAASVLDLQELLSRVVGLISEGFGFYHVGVFLLDPSGEWAVLQAASSEGGRRMLAGGHRLRVGEAGIVGYVTGRGEPRIVLDIGADAAFFDNPDLPDARSEIALPLQARGEIIGALDVQSKEPEAFSEEDVAVLQTLADQVAVAISNARLFQQVEESLEVERRAYGEISREAWRELLQAHPSLGYRYRKGSVAPLVGHPSAPLPGARDALVPQSEGGADDGDAPPVSFAPAAIGARDSAALSDTETMPGEELPQLALPVRVRGHVIGTIQAHKPGAAGEWEVEETALMETLAEQLGLALESARLYQDTQRRALRERLSGEIVSRLRETLDMDTVLQTAVRQIGEALDITEVEVRMGSEVVVEGQES